MKTVKSITKVLFIAILSLAVTGCEDDDFQKDHYGPEVALGQGKVKSLIELDDAGRPEAVGVVFSEEALTGLPHMMRNLELSFPQQVKDTPFDHIGFDWNPHGHEPDGIYNLPHFDIHFYMMSSTMRMQITPDDPLSELLPDASYMPASYIALPGSVPMMGKHWIDPSVPELNGELFTETFLMGSFDSKVTFYEPMITVDYLNLKVTKEFELEFPQAYQQPGKYYPTRYRISFNSVKKEYKVSLRGFIKR